MDPANVIEIVEAIRKFTDAEDRVIMEPRSCKMYFSFEAYRILIAVVRTAAGRSVQELYVLDTRRPTGPEQLIIASRRGRNKPTFIDLERVIRSMTAGASFEEAAVMALRRFRRSVRESPELFSGAIRSHEKD